MNTNQTQIRRTNSEPNLYQFTIDADTKTIARSHSSEEIFARAKTNLQSSCRNTPTIENLEAKRENYVLFKQQLECTQTLANKKKDY